jgi:hypothetical protein
MSWIWNWLRGGDELPQMTLDDLFPFWRYGIMGPGRATRD